MGPMIAAKHFRDILADKAIDIKVNKIEIRLFGSLAYTGKAHGTDKGIVLGLEGYSPESISTKHIKSTIRRVNKANSINISNTIKIPFKMDKNIIFDTKTPAKGHTNTLEIAGYDKTNGLLLKRVYHSIGGGFNRVKGERKRFALAKESPFEFESCDELMEICKKHNKKVHELAFENEIANMTKSELRKKVLLIWNVMNECINSGLSTEGVLEGGLNVKRRAANIFQRLNRSRKLEPLKAMDFVDVYAMAVSEENATGGKLVTAPTNGAAGIIPAVIRYYLEFTRNSNKEAVIRFLLTAGSIGIL